MNLILVLRAEIVCLIILLFLVFVAGRYRMGKHDSRFFYSLLIFALVHVAMDIVTVWTVNHTATVPLLWNDLAHVAFYLSAMLFACGLSLYIYNLTTEKELTRGQQLIAVIPIGIYLLLLLAQVLKIEYVPVDGTWVSEGSAPTVGFAIAFGYILMGLVAIIARWKQVAKHFKLTMLPMLGILILSGIVQMTVKEFLFTGCAVTAATVAFFFTLENPTAVLERKGMMDALSGLGTRSDYERDMVEYDREFSENRDVPFTFMFLDINNLRSVNGLFGHQEGDAYISHVAVLLMTNLRGAERLYRMGGDDFLAIYRGAGEETIVRDIRRVQEVCQTEKETREYAPELAIGYAISDPKYNSLRDVLRVADYMMFRNKADLKRESAEEAIRHTGTHMNLSGLTDRVFDAMCLVSEEYYPFLTNLETDVTRVAPAMVSFFGLEGEFLSDFSTVWQSLVHPDDLQEYTSDIGSTLSGRKQYHFVKYRVRAKNGEYVQVTCRGGVYHGRDGEPDVFAGYLVNHGAVGRLDTQTGLNNHLVLYERLAAALEEKTSAIVIRLAIRNTTRIHMLYGGETSAAVVRGVADLMRQTAEECGEAFSDHGDNLILYLPGMEEGLANEKFRQLRRRLSGGVLIDEEIIPVDLLGGAVHLPHEGLKTASEVRQAALFAVEEASRRDPENLGWFGRSGQQEQDGDQNLLRKVQHDCMMDRSRFCLRFQPIVRASDGSVAGAEALLRWRSEELGEVSPTRFIGFLENDPVYEPLGYDILRMAVRTAGRIQQKLPGFRINVNMTAPQLTSEDFIPRLLAILSEERFDPSCLILELTERCKEMDFALLAQRVEDLRKSGVRVALDDVGTGYSTFDLLLHLPADEIKLDMAFTQELPGNERHEMLASALCGTMLKDGVEICFEGVEDEETLQHLKTYGEVLLQGYYFDQPLLAEEFERKYCGEG